MKNKTSTKFFFLAPLRRHYYLHKTCAEVCCVFASDGDVCVCVLVCDSHAYELDICKNKTKKQEFLVALAITISSCTKYLVRC